eukprot:TRINITY_DN12864_c0_g1_i1.p1 TRINITY_DN12864_c0_g1~~TRINITY_DN12864_c0_g1_i1.p1  ORF type:complete len:397 (-),score=16.69 TRINITY_DN12864_c0_g1_i1:44-1234(-)
MKNMLGVHSKFSAANIDKVQSYNEFSTAKRGYTLKIAQIRHILWMTGLLCTWFFLKWLLWHKHGFVLQRFILSLLSFTFGPAFLLIKLSCSHLRLNGIHVRLDVFAASCWMGRFCVHVFFTAARQRTCQEAFLFWTALYSAHILVCWNIWCDLTLLTVFWLSLSASLHKYSRWVVRTLLWGNIPPHAATTLTVAPPTVNCTAKIPLDVWHVVTTFLSDAETLKLVCAPLRSMLQWHQAQEALRIYNGHKEIVSILQVNFPAHYLLHEVVKDFWLKVKTAKDNHQCHSPSIRSRVVHGGLLNMFDGVCVVVEVHCECVFTDSCRIHRFYFEQHSPVLLGYSPVSTGKLGSSHFVGAVKFPACNLDDLGMETDSLAYYECNPFGIPTKKKPAFDVFFT